MPGSPTTPGCAGTRDVAPAHVAFRENDHVGTRDFQAFAGESAGGISPPASLRTQREALTSLGSHQANEPVLPSFQCAKKPGHSPASRVRKSLALVLCPFKLLNFRITQTCSV
jgi:hypothetical protein